MNSGNSSTPSLFASEATTKANSNRVLYARLVLKLKAAGRGPRLIAREIALDMAEAIYQPEVLEHVPGISNKVCDQLSRLYEPGKGANFPELLRDVPRIKVAQRRSNFYRAALAP